MGINGQPAPIGTCMPSRGQPPLGNYEANAMYNCYAGHGGEELGYVGVTTPTDCASLCDQGDACKGFVYMYSQSKCWMRGEINLGQCEIGEWGQESSTFSTFTKKSTCVQEGQVCGGPGLPDSTGCLTQSCCSNHQCLEVSGHGGKLFCVNPPSR